MCLLFLGRSAHKQYPLILLANRDEFHARPTRRAGFWPDHPAVLAGRDLQAGGTWLGITRGGRWAALTNFREPSTGTFARSRGDIVKDYLTGTASARDYAVRMKQQAGDYDGFNLLLGDPREALWLSNRGGDIERLPEGIVGLSNHLLETPWPKVAHGKRALSDQLDEEPVIDRMFSPLTDQTVYERDLPDTGLDEETERLLSSAFISSPAYGTRSSTLVMVDRNNRVYFEERTYDNPTGGPGGPDEYSSRIFRFRLH